MIVLPEDIRLVLTMDDQRVVAFNLLDISGKLQCDIHISSVIIPRADCHFITNTKLVQYRSPFKLLVIPRNGDLCRVRYFKNVFIDLKIRNIVQKNLSERYFR
ncbi:hypothetical protein SDC9_171760 [bioreactor metagenome]|uniref:Uncharacterized protein n=1 Tax=bioreactor metagenome TaxID=1076179 RepID=A0A645GEC1_9ZZZZ